MKSKFGPVYMIFLKRLLLLSIISLFAFSGCQTDSVNRTLFSELPPEQTGIEFSNDLTFSQDFNIYRYRNFYNGGGVGVGDFNNDGLPDLYFTSNMQENRLYLNDGDLSFTDITAKAGVAGQRAWSTGVSVVDVNGDGYMDIYVCNSGIVQGDDKRNELFINNGDSTFTERAKEFGLDDSALSIHASFFDYDRDGDLDMYLVNNSFRAIGSFEQEENTRNIRNEKGGDKLYRNEGERFVDVSEEAGIYGSEIGFGLGVSVADVNRDGWEDMYVSNDFFERDYLYINNRDGTFSEVLEEQMKSVSAAAMGADVADLNGDGYPEIFVTDMLPDPESRLKQVTTFDDWQRYQKYVRDGYYHQFTRNTLQLNNGNGTFSEVGRYAGVEATDWSWGANIADFNLDGERDLFVANGIYQDLTNVDYLQEVSKEETVRMIVSDSTVNFERLIEMIPSTPISNYAFSNRGGMQFADSSRAWGLDRPGFSNGSAYADLDNDGDLELVINNLNSKASVYQNNFVEQNRKGNWLKIELKGQAPNHFAVGSQVTLWAEGKQWYAEQIPVRGFQSTVDHRLHIGLGDTESVDSLVVQWPDGAVSKTTEVSVNRKISIDREDADLLESRDEMADGNNKETVLEDITDELNLEWQHEESTYNDFSRDRLLFHMRSTEGPPLCIADANGDGFDDFYVGGAKGQAGVLFLQSEEGEFNQKGVPLFLEDAGSEDTDCVWLDANGDEQMDLFVGSGSNEFPPSSSALSDRLYLNEGNGNFVRAELGVPSWRYKTAGSVSAGDFDGDGDTDLFLGVRLQPFGVGLPVNGYLLENDGTGSFEDVTESIAPDLAALGMITDSEWGDVDGDGDMDLVLAGEWMPLTIFENSGDGQLTKMESSTGIENDVGWWNSVRLNDLDGDGDLDILAGNHGKNSRFEATNDQPVEMWINDFDGNGSIEQVISTYKDGKRYPMALRHDLLEMLPELESKYPDYNSYAGQTISDIFTSEQLDQSQKFTANRLESVVGWNDGSGTFTLQNLPMEAQLTPLYDFLTLDITGDGSKEILTGGNLYAAKPEVGRYDAGYGSVFGVDGKEIHEIPSTRSGFSVDGEIRSIQRINSPKYGQVILVARNNAGIKAFRIKK
ncbi:VCBS repeat-containing protein [Balneolaceae bacterium YR4-1]|uniref:VCBS repeat-containing protein n=1 Tax=Halalkalibaculum roseum TaxID=2709311 RepID=A0A6M1SZJ7_9BACT|nr:CRTAC1 family protein [Halalkalibaculum roseum]NGP76614.1 VCBS repeat-containing protein [Halalkalibaculum roseum]